MKHLIIVAIACILINISCGKKNSDGADLQPVSIVFSNNKGWIKAYIKYVITTLRLADR